MAPYSGSPLPLLTYRKFVYRKDADYRSPKGLCKACLTATRERPRRCTCQRHKSSCRSPSPRPFISSHLPWFASPSTSLSFTLNIRRHCLPPADDIGSTAALFLHRFPEFAFVLLIRPQLSEGSACIQTMPPAPVEASYPQFHPSCSTLFLA